MLNPFGSQPTPGSYKDLRNKMLQHVQLMRVEDQIFQVMKNAYEHALLTENVILSRAERKRMLSQIMKSVLEEMVSKLDQASGSA